MLEHKQTQVRSQWRSSIDYCCSEDGVVRASASTPQSSTIYGRVDRASDASVYESYIQTITAVVRSVPFNESKAGSPCMFFHDLPSCQAAPS